MTYVKLRPKCVTKRRAQELSEANCINHRPSKKILLLLFHRSVVSTVCYKINLSWYPVSSKVVSYTCEHRRLLLIICTKIVDIDQYLLKLFENITGVRFFNHSVYMLTERVNIIKAQLPTCDREDFICQKQINYYN